MRKIHTAAAAVAAILFATGVAAQDAPAQQPGQHAAPSPAPAPASVEVSDDQLRGFARAVGVIQQVIQQTPEGQPPSPEHQARVQQAVEQSGLSVEKFNLLAQALPEDPALQQRMAAVMQE